MASFVGEQWLPYLTPFYNLSYPTERPANPDSFPDSSYYKTGPQDLCVVITCIAVMAIARDALRLGVFEPFARWVLYRNLALKRQENAAKLNGKANGVANGNHAVNGGLTRRKEEQKLQRSVMRFAEQGWSLAYYPLQWCFGLYVHRNLPTQLLEPAALWIDYPHIPLAGPLKFYYLTQIAFYLHQVLILNAEARRKDHYQMMTHHVITIFLMIASYYFNFTRVGCLTMFLMDWCDTWLVLAKMMRYLDVNHVYCDWMFAFFLLGWFVTRHFCFMIVIWSTIFDLPRLIPFRWEPENGFYVSNASIDTFIVCLVALQIIQILWCWTICRIAWRVVVTGEKAADDRSDTEESDKDK